MIVTCTHDAGFFSCCSILLKSIIKHFNQYKTLPSGIESSKQFMKYKPKGMEDCDLRLHYFQDVMNDLPTLLDKHVDHEENDDQFQNYKSFDYVRLQPFLDIYFSPSNEIRRLVKILLLKYNHLNPQNLKNTCVLFYRGNDKVKETKLCSYEQMIAKAKEVKLANPKTQFLIQSDETEFIDRMFTEFPDCAFCFQDEIKHMSKNEHTNVDQIIDNTSINYKFSKWFLAITIVMSYCGHIICTSGNCSIWIMYYRRNAHNVHQFLNDEWL
jgi:hypothetical protein